MTDPDFLKSLWATDTATIPPLTPDALRGQAKKFRDKIARRNTIEYLAGVFVIAAFLAYLFLIPETLARVGSALIIFGVCVVLWNLNHRAGAEAKADLDITSAVTAFHKRQLERQYDALKSIFNWYIFPIIPGVIVFLIGTTPEFVAGEPMLSIFKSLFPQAASTAIVFASIWGLNQMAARRLKTQIQAMDHVMK